MFMPMPSTKQTVRMDYFPLTCSTQQTVEAVQPFKLMINEFNIVVICMLEMMAWQSLSMFTSSNKEGKSSF